MLREEVLSSWESCKGRLLRKWEKRKYLPFFRSWIKNMLFSPEQQVDNEQIVEAIQKLIDKIDPKRGARLEYLDMTDTETEED